jgi:hypothetical protein
MIFPSSAQRARRTLLEVALVGARDLRLEVAKKCRFFIRARALGRPRGLIVASCPRKK